MIKKLLILFLFLGFSFGQETSPKSDFDIENPHSIFGTWKNLIGTVSYIFLSNGSGYKNFIFEEKVYTSEKFGWGIDRGHQISNLFEGILVIDYHSPKITNDELNFIFRPKESIDDDSSFSQDKLFNDLNWSGGDILELWEYSQFGRNENRDKLMFFEKF